MVKAIKLAKFWRAVAGVICIAVSLITFFFAYPKTKNGESFPVKTPQINTVLSLWHVDTFEGGVGSRADFLSKISLDFSDGEALVMVTSHTVESAKTAMGKGSVPDMISYGVGVDFVVDYVRKLPKNSFLGGEVGGEFFAYPWCVGGYYLITKTENNRLIDRLFVSQNAYNMPIFAIEQNKIEAKTREVKKPLDAYASFVQSKNSDALLGTQRDVKRLQSRSATFFATALGGFSDIVQYISVCSSDTEKYKVSVEFVRYLLGEKVQMQLDRIGMFSAFYPSGDIGGVNPVDFSTISYTISPFTSAETLKSFISDFKGQNLTNNSLLQMKNVLKRL